MAKKNKSLEELMHLAQQGDKAAYADLLKETSHIVKGYLIKRLSSSADVDDVLQEILISLHNARHTYNSSRPFKPWLFSIAKFRLYDYFRKLYKKQENEHGHLEEISLEYNKNVTNMVEEYEELYEAIDNLPGKQKRIIELMKIEGFTAKEIGKKLSMTESAVKVTAHRTYKILKDKIQKKQQ